MEKDLLLLLVGVVVGAMNAIAGGGMLIGFPVLVATGLPPLVANATGNIVTLPGQIASAIGYRKYLRNVSLKFALLAIPCIIGAAAGALTLRYTPADHFAKLVPLLVLFGVGLFAFQPLLHFHLHRHVRRRSQTILPLLLLGAAFLPITFYGGYFGAGYGFMMLAFLGFTSLPDTHTINALKNISAALVAGVSIACLLSAHLIHWHTGLVMGLGSTIGGYLGAHGAQNVSTHWLRVSIITIGLCAVVYLGLQQY